MPEYKVLKKQCFKYQGYSLVPIRSEDRYLIMKWRNEQMYHLRQNELLTIEKQDLYFDTIVANLFVNERPEQILFSYLNNDSCIGYGGLVHIDWANKNAEISFIMDTNLETEEFDFHWKNYLSMIEELGFSELQFHKLYTFAYVIRPHLFKTLETAGYSKEAIFKEHCFFENQFIDAVMHSKINNNGNLKESENK